MNESVVAVKVVGITSTIPDEGKSTIAAALALSIAQVGGRAILVDCDLRNPSLSRAITPNTNAGILEVLSGKVALDETLEAQEVVGGAGPPSVRAGFNAPGCNLAVRSALRATDGD